MVFVCSKYFSYFFILFVHMADGMATKLIQISSYLFLAFLLLLFWSPLLVLAGGSDFSSSLHPAFLSTLIFVIFVRCVQTWQPLVRL